MAKEGSRQPPDHPQSGDTGDGAPNPPPADDRRRSWRQARHLIWAHRRRLGVGLVLLAFGRVAGLVLPASSKVIIDEVLAHRRPELILPVAAVVALGLLVQAGASFALAHLLGVAAQRTIAELRRQMHRHVMRLPIHRFDESRTGELQARVMTDAESLHNLLGSGVVQLAGGLITALLATTVLFYLDWRLTSIVLAVLLLFAAVMAFTLSRLRPVFRERQRLYAEVSGRLTEAIGGVRIVKAYTGEGRESLLFTRGVHRLLRSIARSITGVAALSAGAGLAFGLMGIALMILGSQAILAGTMTLGDFIMYLAFTGMLAMPLLQIASVGPYLARALAGLDRMGEVLGQATEAGSQLPVEPLPDLRGEVALEGVDFAYQPGTPVLKKISFHAPAGSTTALVGPSGAGKSTLIALLSGFYRPQAGSILIDGVELERLPLRAYRAQLGVVLQDEFLFDGTVAENIAYGRPNASRNDILEAGRLAHCEEFTDRLAKGYDTVIGERGVRLSGGQRQRVSIARALLADPRILLLDEATSSIDSETEAHIREALTRLRQNRTTFVIAHRLSTVTAADQILVLDEGALVECGGHHELLAGGGRYRALYERQSHVEGDRLVGTQG